jgi:hypothetical protein
MAAAVRGNRVARQKWAIDQSKEVGAGIGTAITAAPHVDPTQVSRPRRGVENHCRRQVANYCVYLLRPPPNRSATHCAEQGCSTPSTSADSRAYPVSHLARRVSIASTFGWHNQ